MPMMMTMMTRVIISCFSCLVHSNFHTNRLWNAFCCEKKKYFLMMTRVRETWNCSLNVFFFLVFFLNGQKGFLTFFYSLCVLKHYIHHTIYYTYVFRINIEFEISICRIVWCMEFWEAYWNEFYTHRYFHSYNI